MIEGLDRWLVEVERALAKAQRDARVAQLLTEGFRHRRPNVAAVLGLGDDQAALDAAGLVHSMFTGLLFQQLLDPELSIESERLERAKVRLRRMLPEGEARRRTSTAAG